MSGLQTFRRPARSAADITGILLYLEGCFVQVLEGEESRVMETYVRVYGDPRHHDITLIHSRPIESRDFPAWRMGFQRINWLDIVDRPAYAALRGNRLDGQPLHLTPGLAGQILADFCYR